MIEGFKNAYISVTVSQFLSVFRTSMTKRKRK